MNKTLFFAFLSLVMLFAGMACKKENHDAKVEINILSPTLGQAFEHGQDVPLHVDVSADQELHGWDITLRKKSDNSVIYSKDKHTHGKSMSIREVWVNDVTHHTDVILEVKVDLDHSGSNSKTASVQFHCHPH